MIEAFGAVAAIINSVVGVLNLVILLAGIISLKNGISVIHRQSNSNQDKLISEVRTAALAKGALDEQNREK
jgi:hypothetical protein